MERWSCGKDTLARGIDLAVEDALPYVKELVEKDKQ
jgi:hypothetical protein